MIRELDLRGVQIQHGSSTIPNDPQIVERYLIHCKNNNMFER